MAALTADRCRETSSSTGGGAFTLDGAVSGYQAFATAFPGSDIRLVYYAIVHRDAAEWEVGAGGWAGGTTLNRNVILDSSNAGASVSFSSGTKDVFATFPAKAYVEMNGTEIAFNRGILLP